MDGFALLKQIREVEPRLPVIVISGTQENKMSYAALRHGAGAYLPKAFDPRHVEMLVTTFLDSTKPRAEARSRRALIGLTAHLLRVARTSFCIDCRRTSVMLWRRRTRQLERPIPA